MVASKLSMELQPGGGGDPVRPSGWLPKSCEYHKFMQTVLDECTHALQTCLCRLQFKGFVRIIDVLYIIIRLKLNLGVPLPVSLVFQSLFGIPWFELVGV